MRLNNPEQLDKLKELIGKVREVSDKSEETSDIVKDEYEDVEIEIKKEKLFEYRLKNKALEEENQGDVQDREQRKDFADRIFNFVCNYMTFVCIVLFLKAIMPHFCLSDNVIITLLGTTTANVIGILIIVVTYLFSRKRK